MHAQFCLHLLAGKLDLQLHASLLTQATNLIDIIDAGLGKKPIATTRIAITHSVLWELWIVRNHCTFRNTLTSAHLHDSHY